MESTIQSLQNLSLKSFLNCLEVLCDDLKQNFPECSQSQTLLPALKMMAAANPKAVLGSWHEMMNETSTVGYWRAFKRLTGRDLVFYDVARYKDMTALLTHKTFCSMFSIDMIGKFKKSPPDWQRSFQASILFLNSAAYWYTNLEELPLIPTREIIKENIEKTKTQQIAKTQPAPSTTSQPSPTGDDDPLKKKDLLIQMFTSLGSGFEDESYSAFLKSLEHISNTEVSNFFAQVEAKHGTNLADEANFSALISMDVPIFTQSGLASKIENISPENQKNFCSELSQLLTFSKMASKIPTKLVNTIESKATELSSQISDEHGNVDLSKLDISKMSESIMKDIDPQDLTAMMSNVSSILPDVIKLSQSLPGAAGANQTSGGGENQMAQMLAALSTMGVGK